MKKDIDITKSIKELDETWEKLAKKDPKIYIYSDKGKKVTDEEYRISGKIDYDKYISSDSSLNLKREHKVLEIGCGNGRMSEYIAENFNIVDCIDISNEYIKQGKERLPYVSNIVWQHVNGITYPYPDEYFDFIFSYTVFQHIKSIEIIRKNFEEITRALKSDGIAKIQLRGKSTAKNEWYSGIAFVSKMMIDKLLKDLNLKLIKNEKGHKDYVWLWLKKV